MKSYTNTKHSTYRMGMLSYLPTEWWKGTQWPRQRSDLQYAASHNLQIHKALCHYTITFHPLTPQTPNPNDRNWLYLAFYTLWWDTLFLRRSCLPYTKSASRSTSAPIEGQRVERDTEPVKTVFYRHITASCIKLKYWSYFSLCCDLDTFKAQFIVLFCARCENRVTV